MCSSLIWCLVFDIILPTKTTLYSSICVYIAYVLTLENFFVFIVLLTTLGIMIRVMCGLSVVGVLVEFSWYSVSYMLCVLHAILCALGNQTSNMVSNRVLMTIQHICAWEGLPIWLDAYWELPLLCMWRALSTHAPSPCIIAISQSTVYLIQCGTWSSKGSLTTMHTTAVFTKINAHAHMWLFGTLKYISYSLTTSRLRATFTSYIPCTNVSYTMLGSVILRTARQQPSYCHSSAST